MIINNRFFVRFEPNFDSKCKCIIFDERDDKIYQMSEMYYHYIKLDKQSFSYLLEEKYMVKNNEEKEKIISTIRNNLKIIGINYESYTNL